MYPSSAARSSSPLPSNQGLRLPLPPPHQPYQFNSPSPQLFQHSPYQIASSQETIQMLLMQQLSDERAKNDGLLRDVVEKDWKLRELQEEVDRLRLLKSKRKTPKLETDSDNGSSAIFVRDEAVIVEMEKTAAAVCEEYIINDPEILRVYSFADAPKVANFVYRKGIDNNLDPGSLAVDLEGERLDSTRITEIREVAGRGAAALFDATIKNRNHSAEDLRRLYRVLEDQFWELRLCQGHYKAAAFVDSRRRNARNTNGKGGTAGARYGESGTSRKVKREDSVAQGDAVIPSGNKDEPESQPRTATSAPPVDPSLTPSSDLSSNPTPLTLSDVPIDPVLADSSPSIPDDPERDESELSDASESEPEVPPPPRSTTTKAATFTRPLPVQPTNNEGDQASTTETVTTSTGSSGKRKKDGKKERKESEKKRMRKSRAEAEEERTAKLAARAEKARMESGAGVEGEAGDTREDEEVPETTTRGGRRVQRPVHRDMEEH